MTKPLRASLLAASISMFAATTAYAIPSVQSDATPLQVADGSGATFTTGALSGPSTQQINFEILFPANAAEISFSWNAGISLAGYTLWSSSGPATWSLTSITPGVTFTGTGRSRSSNLFGAPAGYYSLVFDVSGATSANQKINGNIDVYDVPAPAALGLLGIGLLGMGCFNRRKGNTAS